MLTTERTEDTEEKKYGFLPLIAVYDLHFVGMTDNIVCSDTSRYSSPRSFFY